MSLTVYFAGPDVFSPGYADHRRRVAALCQARGLIPLFPGDDVSGDHPAAIFADNLRLIARADAVVANLGPFRGAEPDSGTCFELGYAHAAGKRLYGYVDREEMAVDRVARLQGPLERDGDGWLDRDGWRVEDFGLPLNLMLAVPATIVAGTVENCLDRLCRDA